MTATLTVGALLDEHVVLDVQCLDRIYLNGYVPGLQTPGGVWWFLRKHLGYAIASPAILEKIGTRFRRSVTKFAADNHIPVVRFGKDDRKIDVMARYVQAQARTGRSGVAGIGTAQEIQKVYLATLRDRASGGAPNYSFTKANRPILVFYFYLWDAEFGPAFIKIASYFPYPMKVWVNGHEWAKRQCVQRGIAYTALSNGFATCADPTALQGICDRLGSADIQAFLDRWLDVLPLPLTPADEAAGYWWELSMRQIEVSRTLVFDMPRRARAFTEALIADNLDIGRPDSVELIFTGRRRGDIGRPIKNTAVCKTKVISIDTEVSMNAFFKHSRIKQYLKLRHEVARCERTRRQEGRLMSVA
jgi:hypothetical protein